MVAAPELNLDITSIGIITSIFPLFYGCSKFVSGVVGDVLSARAMLACGLGLTVRRARRAAPRSRRRRHPHLHHLTLPQLSPPPPPPGGRQHHVRPRLDAAVVLRAVGPQRHPAGLGRPGVREDHHVVVRHQGARHVLGALEHLAQPRRVPRAAARRHRRARPRLAVGRLRARPHRPLRRRTRVRHRSQLAEDIGRQPAEVAQADDAAAVEVAEAVAEAEQSGGAEMGMVERLRKNVLSQPAVWLLAFTFLFVYLIRQALTSWMVFFLIEKKGVSDFAQAAAAAARHARLHRRHRTAAPPPAATAPTATPPPPPPPPPLSNNAPPDALRRRRRARDLELGGLTGSLIARKLSDKLIANAKPGEGHVGKRLLVVRGYLIGVAGALELLWALPP